MGNKQTAHAATDSGVVKAAALLEWLGKQESSKILCHFTQGELERLSAGFFQLNKIPYQERKTLAEKTFASVQAKDTESSNPLDFARNILVPLLGHELTHQLLKNEATNQTTSVSLEWIPDSMAEPLALMLNEESPAIVAIVLSLVQPSLAARLLSLLPNELRGESLLQLGKTRSPMSESVLAVSKKIASRIRELEQMKGADAQHSSISFIGGAEKVVEVLRRCSRTTERSSLDYLEEHAPEIAQEVSQRIFSSTEDLKWLDNMSLQTVLRSIDMNALSRALRGASNEVRELCYKNLSENAAATLREEIENLGPIPKREVEESTQQVLQTIRGMIEDGRIQLTEEEEMM